MMISRYQKMISQGIISDILISAGGEQLEHCKLAHYSGTIITLDNNDDYALDPTS